MTRTMTYAEFTAEATEQFGRDRMAWAFRCPNCGDVATPRDFALAAGEWGRAGQECIGRTLRRDDPKAERGCNWTAYGLIPGPWEILLPAEDEGAAPERSMRAFPLADPATDSPATVGAGGRGTGAPVPAGDGRQGTGPQVPGPTRTADGAQ